MLVLSQRVLDKPTCFRSIRLQKLQSLCRPTKDWGETPETAHKIPAPDTEAVAVDLNEEGSVKKESTEVVSDELSPSHSNMHPVDANTTEVTVGTVEREASLPAVVD